MRKKIRSIVLATAIAWGGHAHAGALTGGATEVTQILNNIELLLQTLQQYEEYATQLEQYETQLAQLEPSELRGFMQSASELEASINRLRALKGAQDNAYGALDEVKRLAEGRLEEWQKSGLEWGDYIERSKLENKRTHDQLQVLRDHEIHAMERVEQVYADLKAHARDAQSSEGTHSAVQVLNGQMNTLIALMNDVREHDVMQARYDTERFNRELLEKEAERVERDKLHQEAVAGHEQTSEIVKQLRSQAGL